MSIIRIKKLRKINKLPERKDDTKNNKKNTTTKPDSDSVIELQASNRDSIMAIEEDNDSVGLRSLPKILKS